MTRGLLLGTRVRGRQRLSRRLGPVRQLRLHRAADLSRLEHRAVARHDRRSGGSARRSRCRAPALLGVGYAAVGTTHGTADERDYHYGVAPQALLALRLIYGDRASLDLTGREYFVSNVGAAAPAAGTTTSSAATPPSPGASPGCTRSTFKLIGNRRDARFTALGSTRQTQVDRGIFYTLLGQDRFGVVDWR